MNISFDEDPFAKSDQGIGKIYHEVLMLMKFLQTEPQLKNMNINYYHLNYNVFKNKDEKEIVVNQYENVCIRINDFVPNHYIGQKNDDEILLR